MSVRDLQDRTPLDASTIRLWVWCRDRPGVVAAVSGFLFSRGANIIHADQHSSEDRFFMRLVATLSSSDSVAAVRHDLGRLARDYDITSELSLPDPSKRVTILVSRQGHCLLDLLGRFEQAELEGTPKVIVSNHPDLRVVADRHGVPFHHIPSDGQDVAEERILELVGDSELVVLARYMQILSKDFLDRLRGPVINIHHSFLPAFPGANPYERAVERGVKIIGATAHYVTVELDGGPIIEQDVARVSHRDDVADVRRIGRDVERVVLARAVKLHLEDRVLVDGRRTVVF